MTQLPIIPTPTPKISDPLHIDPKNFVPSLLEEGVRVGVMTQNEADAVYAAILNILAESILSVSKERSTSVKEETAKKLLDNILFHMETALKESGSPGTALMRLKAEDIRQIYIEGRGMANRAWNEACELWEKMNKALRNDMDIHYKQLIISTLSSYLGNYNYQFEPKAELTLCLPSLGIDCCLCGIHAVLAAMRTLSELSL